MNFGTKTRYEGAKRRARKMGKSLSQHIRDLVAADLDAAEKKA